MEISKLSAKGGVDNMGYGVDSKRSGQREEWTVRGVDSERSGQREEWTARGVDNRRSGQRE